MKAKKHPDKALKQKRSQLAARLKHGPVFTVFHGSKGEVKVAKLDKKSAMTISNIQKRRDRYLKGLKKVCRQVVIDFNPLQQVAISEKMAVRQMYHQILNDRARYLSRGKCVPGWYGPLEYQFRVATALILLLESYHVDTACRVRPAKARHNKLQRH